MSKKMLILWAVALAAFVVPCSAAPDIESPNEKQEIERATARFYEGLNSMFAGDTSAMKQVWSHADDVTYMGPDGGIEIGWKQVEAKWETQARLKLGGEVVTDEMHVTLAGDMAVVQCRELGHNLDAQGRPIPVSIRATNVFRKENGTWKMVGHHTDLLPFLTEEPSGIRAE